jgi:phosphoglycolate phosphatase-like HAD superfamily hydrolase
LVSYCGLVLFDIDGTLLRRAGPHHRQALVHGIRRVTGLDTTTDGIPVQGMLDPIILAEMMRRAGAKRALIRQSLPEVERAAERYYRRVCPSLEGKHCPGVEPLLDRLRRRGFLLALVTGNLTRIGWHKLERAGIAHYFRYGAFGEMAATRGRLVKWAIHEARQRHALPENAAVTLVGDATSDVIAAGENGIPVVAVRTGITPVEDLEALAPDYLLRNLREFRLPMAEGRANRRAGPGQNRVDILRKQA